MIISQMHLFTIQTAAVTQQDRKNSDTDMMGTQLEDSLECGLPKKPRERMWNRQEQGAATPEKGEETFLRVPRVQFLSTEGSSDLNKSFIRYKMHWHGHCLVEL